jgi:two-component system, NtrC family, response regulator HydG
MWPKEVQMSTPYTEVQQPEDVLAHLFPAEMAEMKEQVLRVSVQETKLLLTGETGTGKTRLGRLVHEMSPRRDEPFLILDCGALSPSLVHSELFGHVKGAFTGAERDRPGKLAAAGRGTLLLDEVDSLSLPLQALLLRAVDEQVFHPVGANRPQALHARLIAVTNVSLEEAVAAGRFRSDLYYRLNVVGFRLLPLRERRPSIIPLAKKFLAEFAGRHRTDIRGLLPDALGCLQAYDWPGNIRELRNVIERAVALSPGPEIRLQDLPENLHPVERSGNRWRPASSGDDSETSSVPFTLRQTKTEVEIRRIVETLRKHGNNRLRAAAELGISRMGLYKKLHKYGLIEATCKLNL